MHLWYVIQYSTIYQIFSAWRSLWFLLSEINLYTRWFHFLRFAFKNTKLHKKPQFINRLIRAALVKGTCGNFCFQSTSLFPGVSLIASIPYFVHSLPIPYFVARDGSTGNFVTFRGQQFLKPRPYVFNIGRSIDRSEELSDHVPSVRAQKYGAWKIVHLMETLPNPFYDDFHGKAEMETWWAVLNVAVYKAGRKLNWIESWDANKIQTGDGILISSLFCTRMKFV